MLGEKIGELNGEITVKRVLPPDGHAAKMETTFEIEGPLLGTEVTMTGTYWSVVRPDGSIYGECPNQGVLMTKDGGMATWSAAGIGKFTGKKGAVSFRGAQYFQTKDSNMARLNKIAVVYEFDTDDDGKVKGTFWEWT